MSKNTSLVYYGDRRSCLAIFNPRVKLLKDMCYYHFGNMVRNGAVSIMKWGLLTTSLKWIPFTNRGKNCYGVCKCLYLGTICIISEQRLTAKNRSHLWHLLPSQSWKTETRWEKCSENPAEWYPKHAKF